MHAVILYMPYIKKSNYIFITVTKIQVPPAHHPWNPLLYRIFLHGINGAMKSLHALLPGIGPAKSKN